MDESRFETVELRLAEAGSDLMAAIEAAQYARVVDHEDAGTPDESVAIDRFLETFADAAEKWEDLGAGERRALLAGLGDLLEELETLGWYVHWGILRRQFLLADRTAARLPVAVLTISRSGLPTCRIMLPAQIAVEQDPTSFH